MSSNTDFPTHPVTKNSQAQEHYRPLYDLQDTYSNNKELPTVPVYMDIEPSAFCNLDCIFCMRTQMKRTNQNMTMHTFDRVVKQAATFGIKGIRMIGWGEPYINTHIFQMIEKINAAGLKSHITSNGIVLDAKKIGKIFETGLHSQYFSMQGVTESEYGKLRKTDEFPKLRENIYALIKERNERGLDYPWVQITTSVTDESKEEIKQFVDYWEKVVDKVSVSYTWTKRMKDKTAIKEWVDRSKELPHYFECNEIRAKMTLHANGNVVPCCEDYDDEMVFGNVNEESLDEIWNGTTSTGFRMMLCQKAGNQDFFHLCKDCELCHRHRGDATAFKEI